MFPQADLIQTLRNLPWFLELKNYQLERLAEISQFVQLDSNADLFHEGDREDFLYILLQGQISIETFVPTRGKVPVYTAEPLDIIGWSSLTPVVRQRTATCCALTPCKLLAIDGEALRQLCDEDNHIGYIVMRRIANVVASRFLTTRLHLLDLIVHHSETAE